VPYSREARLASLARHRHLIWLRRRAKEENGLLLHSRPAIRASSLDAAWVGGGREGGREGGEVLLAMRSPGDKVNETME